MAADIDNMVGDMSKLSKNLRRLADGFDSILFDDDAAVPKHSIFLVHRYDHCTVQYSHQHPLFLSLHHPVSSHLLLSQHFFENLGPSSYIVWGDILKLGALYGAPD